MTDNKTSCAALCYTLDINGIAHPKCPVSIFFFFPAHHANVKSGLVLSSAKYFWSFIVGEYRCILLNKMKNIGTLWVNTTELKDEDDEIGVNTPGVINLKLKWNLFVSRDLDD